jgi:hypothetical protein
MPSVLTNDSTLLLTILLDADGTSQAAEGESGPARSSEPFHDFAECGCVARWEAEGGMAGLAFAAVIYIVCLSGTLAVFAGEFIRWKNADAPRVEGVSPAAG